jgi:hypothetical protein
MLAVCSRMWCPYPGVHPSIWKPHMPVTGGRCRGSGEFADSIRCSSGSRASCIISDARSTRTGMGSTSWCKAGAVPKQPNASSANCSRPAVCSAGYRDGQAQKLRRRQTRYPARCRASTKPLSQQSRRGLAPANTTTRTAEAAVYVSSPRATFPVHPQSDPQPLSASPSPPLCQQLPESPHGCLPYMARCGRGSSDRVTPSSPRLANGQHSLS